MVAVARDALKVAVAAGVLAAVAATPAHAVPSCDPMPRAEVLVSGQPRLESITGDARGRLLFTDITNDRLLRLDGRGQEPKVITDGLRRPGGLVFDADGSLVAGFSGGALSGVPGNGMAGLFRIDPETGDKIVFAGGMDQANGVVRGRDGSFFASNNIAGVVARVSPSGEVEEPWAQVESANGLAIDSGERYLYAAQTFTPAKIARVELADPTNVTTFFAAPPEDTAAGLDGVTRDGADRLFVAANGAGEVWRVDTDGRGCALARGLRLPSAVAFGTEGAGFDPRNLYVVTFSGNVIELVGVTERPPAPPPAAGQGGASSAPRLAVRVTPRRTRIGRRTRFTIVVSRASGGPRAPAPGATLRFGGRRYTTGARGTLRVVRRFRRPGLVRVRASFAGYPDAAARIVVTGRGRRPTLAG